MESSANGKEKKQPDSSRRRERLESYFFLTDNLWLAKLYSLVPWYHIVPARLCPSVNYSPSLRLMAFGGPLRGNILFKAEIIAYFYRGRERPEGGNNGNRD